VKYGVSSQQGSHPNFYAYLKGKVAFAKMLNPHKTIKLQQLFSKIKWENDK